ncbi:MAG: hypothetical protein QXG39_09515 [Candidatus Aenigmatarchaeota archaeon]
MSKRQEENLGEEILKVLKDIKTLLDLSLHRRLRRQRRVCGTSL